MIGRFYLVEVKEWNIRGVVGYCIGRGVWKSLFGFSFCNYLFVFMSDKIERNKKRNY